MWSYAAANRRSRIEKVEVGVNALSAKMGAGFQSLNDGRGAVLDKVTKLDSHINKIEPSKSRVSQSGVLSSG